MQDAAKADALPQTAAALSDPLQASSDALQSPASRRILISRRTAGRTAPLDIPQTIGEDGSELGGGTSSLPSARSKGLPQPPVAAPGVAAAAAEVRAANPAEGIGYEAPGTAEAHTASAHNTLNAPQRPPGFETRSLSPSDEHSESPPSPVAQRDSLSFPVPAQMMATIKESEASPRMEGLLRSGATSSHATTSGTTSSSFSVRAGAADTHRMPGVVSWQAGHRPAWQRRSSGIAAAHLPSGSTGKETGSSDGSVESITAGPPAPLPATEEAAVGADSGPSVGAAPSADDVQTSERSGGARRLHVFKPSDPYTM